MSSSADLVRRRETEPDRERPEPGQRDDAKRQPPVTAVAGERDDGDRRERSAEDQADGVGTRAEGRSSRHLMANDEREDRTRETHPEPDPDRQREDQHGTRDGEPHQSETDDQARARRERPARARGASPAAARAGRRSPCTGRGSRSVRRRRRARCQGRLDARQQRTDGDDLCPEHQRDRDERDQRPGERTDRPPVVRRPIRRGRSRFRQVPARPRRRPAALQRRIRRSSATATTWSSAGGCQPMTTLASVPTGQVIVEERLGVELGATEDEPDRLDRLVADGREAVRDRRVDRDGVAGLQDVLVEPDPDLKAYRSGRSPIRGPGDAGTRPAGSMLHPPRRSRGGTRCRVPTTWSGAPR